MRPAERREILKAFKSLTQTERDKWDELGIREVPPGEPFYLFPATDRVWTFFTIAPTGQFVIEDIFPPERLDRFAVSGKETTSGA
jgi:hypothetical protein